MENKEMFGKLTFSAIPYHEPIIMFTYMIIIIVSVLIFCSITYVGKWKYLWKNWITTLDHKKIAIMYMILGLVMLIRGFIDALMMRMQQYVASIENSNINLLPP
ncbi:cytochrome o ubiquinol oxidase subunit I, partial [Buchnera aphidicola (Hormaphis cornu)]